MLVEMGGKVKFLWYGSRMEPYARHEVAWYVVAYKLIFGLLEVLAGLGLLFFSRQAMVWYRTVVVAELSEDPHDLLALVSSKILPTILTHHTYLVVYLLALGGAKVAGAVGLFFGRNWGVDLLVGLTIAMFPFQTVELFLHPSIMNFLYISTGMLIALYLVEWRPHIWARRLAIRAHHLVWKQKITPEKASSA